MPTDQIISMLRAERDKIDRALQALEAGVKRRGRPPGKKAARAQVEDLPDWVEPSAKTAPKTKRRFSVAQRKAASKRMKERWAKRKAVAQPKTKAKKTTTAA